MERNMAGRTLPLPHARVFCNSQGREGGGTSKHASVASCLLILGVEVGMRTPRRAGLSRCFVACWHCVPQDLLRDGFATND